MKKFLLLLPIVVSGCGGNDDSEPVDADSVTPTKFTVFWPERSRQFGGLDGAISVRVTLMEPGNPIPVLEETYERPADPAASVSTYTSARHIHPGAYEARVDYYSRASGTGSRLGGAAVQLRVGADGTLQNLNGDPLGLVDSFSLITEVNFVFANAPKVGRDSFIYAVVKFNDFTGAVLTRGSISCQQLAGEEFAAITGDCTITPLQGGGPVAARVTFGQVIREQAFSVFP